VAGTGLANSPIVGKASSVKEFTMTRTLNLLLSLLLLGVPAVSSAGEDEEWHDEDSTESPHDGDFEVDIGLDLFSVEVAPSQTSVTVLDLVLLTVFDLQERGERYRKLEVLDAPLISVYESKRRGDRYKARVLSVPFFSVYRKDVDGDESDTRVLSLPLIGSVYRHEVDGDRHRREFLFFIDIETRD
jgi:hypothetical protein